MASLNYSSELMQNYLQAEVISPQTKFEALQTKDGHSLLFAIGTDGVFNLIQEHSGVSTAGWLRTDLSSAQISQDFANVPGAVCRTFGAGQSAKDGTLSLSMVVETSAGDNLYLSLGNSNTDTDTAWAAAPKWVAYPFDNKNVQLSKLVIVNTFFCELSYGQQFIIVDVLRDPSSPVQNIYRFYLDPKKTDNYSWHVHDIAVDIEPGGYSSCLGQLPNGHVDGLYTAGSAGASGQIIFTPVINVFDGGPPLVIRLDLPSGVIPGTIAAARNVDLSTDLFVIGGGSLYYFASTDQQDSAQGTLLATNALFVGATQLYAYKTSTYAYLWALNQANQVFYMKCPVAQLTTTCAWSVPVPISTGVNAISPYVNLTNEGNTFFAVSGSTLHKMMMSPTTNLWTTQDITLPAPPATTKAQRFSSYTTRLQLTDSADQPVANAPLLISATSRGGFFINNLYYVLDTAPIPILTDATGSITIVESVQKLHATQLLVAESDTSKPVPINPMDKPFNKIASLNSVASLQSAVITSSDGSTRPLVSAASAQDLTLAAKANQNLATAYASVAPSPQLHRAALGLAAPATPLTDFPGAIATAIGDLFRWLESGIEALVSIVQDSLTKAWHFMVTLAGSVYHAVLDCVEAVIGAAEWIFNAIKTAIADLLKYLEFLFAWADIARTKAVVSNLSRIFLTDRISGVQTIKNELSGLITGAQATVNSWAGITGWTGLGPAATTPPTANSTPAKATTAPSALLSYHMQHNISNATSSATMAAFTARAGGSPADPLVQALAQEEQVIGQVGAQLTTLAEQFTTLSLAELLEKLIAILVDGVLGSTQVVLDALLDILAELATDVLSLLDTPIYVPVLSDILSEFGVPSLSILDLFGWVTAVAVTLGYKLVEGEAPFPDSATTTLLITAPDFQTVVKAYNPAAGPQGLRAAAQASAPTPDQQALFKVGHVMGGMCTVLAGLIGMPEALSPADENPTTSRSATVFGVLSGIAVAWPNYVVPVVPIKDPGISLLSTVVGGIAVASPLVIFAAGAAGSLENPRLTSAQTNVVLMIPKLLCTCWHFAELSEVAAANDKTQAILEETSNVLRYLSAIAYLTAVETPPDTLAAGLYGATLVCAGGLQIAEGEIPLV